MKSPSSAIAFELWAKNRWPLACLAIIICASGLGYSLERFFSPNNPGIGLDLISLSAFFTGISVFFALGIFACTEFNNDYDGFGFPKRFFFLPIGTGHLVAILAGIGVIGIWTIYLAWACIVFWPSGVVLPIGYHLTCLAAAVVVFQAVVWGLRIFPVIRALVVCAFAFGFLYLAMRPFGLQTWRAADQWHASLQLFPFLFVAPIASWTALTNERHGSWNSPFTRTNKKPRRSIISAPPLKSTRHALEWLEWKANGRVPLTVLMILMVPAICGSLGILSDAFLGLAVFANTFVLPTFLFFAGTLIGRDCNSKTLKASLFMGAIPCSIEDILVAKLRLFLLIGSTGSVVGALYSWNLANASSDFVLKQSSQDLEIMYLLILGAPALTWTWLAGGMPGWLTGRIESVVTAFALTLGLLFTLTAVFFFLLQTWPERVMIVLCIALGLKAFGAISAFVISYRRGLLRLSTIAAILAVWVVITSAMAAAGILVSEQIAWPITRTILVGILICPLARIAFCPLSLDYNRHR